MENNGKTSAGDASAGNKDNESPVTTDAPGTNSCAEKPATGQTNEQGEPADTALEKNTTNLNWRAFLTAVYIFIVTIALFFAFIAINKKLDKKNKVCYTVLWKNNEAIHIKPGPPWFQYDQKADSIRSLKIIDEADKKLLLALAEDTSGAKTDTLNVNMDSFNQAIESLAFKTNSEKRSSYYLLILIFAVCGAFGSQLRMIYRFIGVTCYKRIFDFNLWWPWYFLLPLLGAVIGPILFMLVEGNLLNYSTTANYSSFLIALTIIAGFAADDFVRKLNQISEAFWGESKADNKSGTNGKSGASGQAETSSTAAAAKK
ncbi:MAG TPA: hypothetical protein PKW80_02305 [Bacteroidales bacterium]|nr:hypothetical protein [Bacteroidales bacterium]